MSDLVSEVAPIVASVWKILVEVGERVEAGAILAVVESMKMEIPIPASAAGVVESIPVQIGQIVQEGDVIVALTADPVWRNTQPQT